MLGNKWLSAAVFAVAGMLGGCDDDDRDELREETTVEPVVPAVPHGSSRTVITAPAYDDVEVDDDGDEYIPPSTRNMPPPAASGDPRMTIPEDNRIPAQQENSNRQFADEPLPP